MRSCWGRKQKKHYYSGLQRPCNKRVRSDKGQLVAGTTGYHRVTLRDIVFSYTLFPCSDLARRVKSGIPATSCSSAIVLCHRWWPEEVGHAS
jgi:hypothetical protein